MLRTYQGRYENGRVILPEHEQALIPIIITVLEDAPFIKTTAQQQLEAFNKFVSGIKTIDDEPLTDEAFAELEKNHN